MDRLALLMFSVTWFFAALPVSGFLQAEEVPQRNHSANSQVIDHLFAQLGAAHTPLEAKKIADRIERRWNYSGSDTVDLLSRRSAIAASQSDYALAIELLDRAIVLKPAWAEAYHQRAAVFVALDDDRRAVADLAQALRLEPRHYDAMIMLAALLQKQDQKKSAYALYQHVLTLYPMHETVQHLAEQLRKIVQGQDL